MSLGPQDTTVLLDHVHIWFCFVCYSFSWHLQMAWQIVFTDSGFWKYSWAHWILSMSMTESCRWVMQCHRRARRPRASNKGLRPCTLRTEISPVSLNLLMMFSVGLGDISLAICMRISSVKLVPLLARQCRIQYRRRLICDYESDIA